MNIIHAVRRQAGNILHKIATRNGYVRAEDQSKLIGAMYAAQGGAGISAPITWYNLVSAYKSWVYICVDRIAKDVAMIPVKLYIYRQKGKKINDALSIKAYMKSLESKKERNYYLKQIGIVKEEITSHPWLETIWKPNKLMTRFNLWYNIMIRLELGGLCGLYKVKDRLGITREIWPLPLTKTSTLKAIADSKLILKSWRYTEGEITEEFQPEEIVPLIYASPESPFVGHSALMAQTYPYDIDMYLMMQQKALFENQAITDNLVTDQKLTKAQVKELKELIDEEYSGAVRSGKTMILHSGLKSDRRGQTSREAMINEVASWVSEKLISAYDKSKGNLGIVTDVNRANMETLRTIDIQNCLKPRCMLIEEAIESFWLPDYDKGLTCDFELPDIEDKEFRLREIESRLNTYQDSINMIRTEQGKPPVPWGDQPWIPFTLTQMGSSASTPPELEKQKLSMKILSADKQGMTPEWWTEERKVIYWKAFINKTDRYERMIVEPMRRYFHQVENEVVKRLNEQGRRIEGRIAGWGRQKVQQHLAANGQKGLSDINIDIEDEAKRLILTFEPIVKIILGDAGNARLKELGVGVAFNVNDPTVMKWLGARMDKFSKEVAGTTFDAIKDILRDGFTEGQPLSVIADTLREKFDSWDKYRAPLIARTETIASANFADLDSIKQAQLDEKLKKSWLSARDSACRDTHLIADQTYQKGIQVDEYFEVGADSMLSPGNGSDPAENVNCRCTMIYLENE